MDYNSFQIILVYQYKFGELPYELIDEELLIREVEYSYYAFCLYDDIDIKKRFWISDWALDEAIDIVLS